MSEASVISRISETLGKNRIKSIQSPRERRVNLEIEKAELKDVASILKNEGFHHLSTITAQEDSEVVEVIYHLSDGGNVVNMRVALPLNDTSLPTLTDVYPGAVLYEQEVNELMGVEFLGHPSMGRLILPEQWPRGSYLLRKDKGEPLEKDEADN